MIQNGEKTWFNQQLMFHYDKSYHSDSSMEFAISSSTENMKNFSPPALTLSITTQNMKRSYFFSIQNASDLLKSLSSANADLKSLFQGTEDSTILKRYNKDKDLIIRFKTVTSTGEPVIQLEIRSSDVDYGFCIIPLSMFSTVANMVKMYVTDYFNLCMSFQNKFILAELTEKVDGLERWIKTSSLSMMQGAQEKSDNFNSTQVESVVTKTTTQVAEVSMPVVEEVIDPPWDTTETESTLNEFDNFLGKDMDNIVVPGIETVSIQTEVVRDISSTFIETVLQNKIENFENIMNSVYQADNPFLTFLESIKPAFPNNGVTPNMQTNTLKSVCYLTKLMFKEILQKYIELGEPIPLTATVVKYDPDNVEQQNIELAYDLLLLQGYIRATRTKMEGKFSDAQKTKAILFFAMRSFTDVLVYSFLETTDKATIKSAIIARFKSYKERGFFKSYENMLVECGCVAITESEINSFVDVVCENVIGKVESIEEFHKDCYNNKRALAPFNNELSLEQITNEVVPVEISKKLNKPAPKALVISAQSAEILGIKKSKNTDTNIFRFIKSYRDEIPETHLEEFNEYVESVGTTNIDISKFPLEEFGEDIVKAIYVWNNSDNKAERYTDYFSKHETCSLDKNLIMAQFKSVQDVVADDWANALSVNFNL